MSVEKNSKLNDSALNEEQLEKVSGGLTEGEQRVIEHQQAVKEENERRWMEDAERREEEEQERIKRYKENQDRMKEIWYANANR